jgi:hypothetical protein
MPHFGQNSLSSAARPVEDDGPIIDGSPLGEQAQFDAPNKNAVSEPDRLPPATGLPQVGHMLFRVSAVSFSFIVHLLQVLPAVPSPL